MRIIVYYPFVFFRRTKCTQVWNSEGDFIYIYVCVYMFIFYIYVYMFIFLFWCEILLYISSCCMKYKDTVEKRASLEG